MRARSLAAALVLGLGLSACSNASGQETSPAPRSTGTGSPGPSSGGATDAPSIELYVAMGDSFTAAPFVPSTDLAGGCLRSSGNYPALVAADLGLSTGPDGGFADVSCSAAVTADLTARQQVAQGQGSAPAQVEALSADTDLVTIGVGGNDEALFATLVRCISQGPVAQVPGGTFDETGCLGPRSGSDSPAATIRRTGARVENALERIGRSAPEARIVLVGYPRLVGATGGCRRLPIAPADLRQARAMERALSQALARAARRTEATYVDVYQLSRGHAVCSDDPWVNGRKTDQTRALAFHPFAAEQQAVADAVLAALIPTS